MNKYSLELLKLRRSIKKCILYCFHLLGRVPLGKRYFLAFNLLIFQAYMT